MNSKLCNHDPGVVKVSFESTEHISCSDGQKHDMVA